MFITTLETVFYQYFNLVKFLKLSLLNDHFFSILGFILLFLKCNIIYLIFRAESKFQGLIKFLLLIIILWVSFHFYLRYIGKKKFIPYLNTLLKIFYKKRLFL